MEGFPGLLTGTLETGSLVPISAGIDMKVPRNWVSQKWSGSEVIR